MTAKWWRVLVVYSGRPMPHQARQREDNRPMAQPLLRLMNALTELLDSHGHTTAGIFPLVRR